MAHYRIDDVGVSQVRHALAADPAIFRDCATRLSTTVWSVNAAVEPDGAVLVTALERYRLVHVGSLTAIADAVAALGGDLDLVVDSASHTEASVALAYSGGSHFAVAS